MLDDASVTQIRSKHVLSESRHVNSLLEAGLTPGELSDSLTQSHTGTCKMKVYHYDSEQPEVGEGETYSGEQHSAEQLISNYDVTFMQQEDVVNTQVVEYYI